MLPKNIISEGIISAVADRLRYRDNVKAGDILDCLDIYVQGFNYSFDEKYAAIYHIANIINVEISA